jgi:hypothetical protein
VNDVYDDDSGNKAPTRGTMENSTWDSGRTESIRAKASSGLVMTSHVD